MSALAIVLLGGLLNGPVQVGDTAAPAAAILFLPAAAQSQPFESHLRGWTRTGLKGGRRWFRRAVALVVRSVKMWLAWFWRSLRFILLAALFALAEGRLLSAWRLEGLPALRSYVPSILYVYVGLLTDRAVPLRGKLALLASIGYGVVRADVIPDRSLLPGLIDDALLIALAVHLLRSSCPAATVDRWAERAVAWRERTVWLKGQRAGGGRKAEGG